MNIIKQSYYTHKMKDFSFFRHKLSNKTYLSRFQESIAILIENDYQFT